MKIYILGHSGSGKTYLGKKLSKKLNIPHYELDKTWHLLDRNRELFRSKVLEFTNQDSWIIDGKHRTTRKDLLLAADKVIFLDLGLIHSVLTNIGREVRDTGRLSFSFLKHLRRVVKEYLSIQSQMKHEFKELDIKSSILHSRKEVNEYLDSI